jgi:hypothetical protein
LGLIQPFGVVTCLAALGAWLAWEWLIVWRAQRPTFWQTIVNRAHWPGRLLWLTAAVALGGLPWILYDQIIVRRHPALSVWNAQNLTWTPPAWDVLLALLPALGLAAWVIKDRTGLTRPALRLAPAWLLVSLALIYLPFDLQRRFMTGIYMPTALLAGHALGVWQAGRPKVFTRLRLWAAVLSAPTLLLLLALAAFGSISHQPEYYLSADESAALAWIEQHTAPRALILASPQSSLFIPGLTGRRVVYGHPYETVHAEQAKAAVERFFSLGAASGGDLAAQGQAFISQQQVDYIFYGPREQKYGSLPGGLNLRAVFSRGSVTVYQP